MYLYYSCVMKVKNSTLIYKGPSGCCDLQADSDSSPVSERPCTTVPVGLLCPSPVLIGGICVPPTVNCLQYLVTGSTLMAVGSFQLPAPQSVTHSRISSGTQPSVWTVSDGCLKLICLLNTSAFSALKVLTTTAPYKFTYLLTFSNSYC